VPVNQLKLVDRIVLISARTKSSRRELIKSGKSGLLIIEFVF